MKYKTQTIKAVEIHYNKIDVLFIQENILQPFEASFGRSLETNYSYIYIKNSLLHGVMYKG